MKNYILILLTTISFGAFSQNYTTLPTGAKPYGNQTYIVPSTDLIVQGNAGYGFRVIGTKKYVDELNSINRVVVDTANFLNKRNDQPSIVKLNDGRLVIAYSHFATDPGDEGLSKIWRSYSSDNGRTWGNPQELIGLIDGKGTYIPSFYKKPNGNIICLFFVRTSLTPTPLSAIYKIEYNADMTFVVSSASQILAPTGYFPIGSDRLFYDEANERLLFPYPKLLSGSSQSTLSIYEGRLLVSNNQGNTWVDAGLSFGTTLINNQNYGGATEPGIYLNPKTKKPVYYFGTLLGSYWASELTFSSGNSYTKSSEYNTNLYASNGFGSIKLWNKKQMLVGAKIRLLDNLPLDYAKKKKIDLSGSYDGVNWFDLLQIDDAEIGGFYANEPTIFIDDDTDRLNVSYSISYIDENYYYLKNLSINGSYLNSAFSKKIENQTFSYQKASIKIDGNIDILSTENTGAIKIKRITNNGNYADIRFYDANNVSRGRIGLLEDGANQYFNITAINDGILNLNSSDKANLFGSYGIGSSSYFSGIKNGKFYIGSDSRPISFLNDNNNYSDVLNVDGTAKILGELKIRPIGERQFSWKSSSSKTWSIEADLSQTYLYNSTDDVYGFFFKNDGRMELPHAPTTANGIVRKQELDLKANIASTTLTVLEYADNAAAVTGGLAVGRVYRTGDLLKIVH